MFSRRNVVPMLVMAGVFLILGLQAAALVRMLVNRQATAFDDAYMFARYARHWNDGAGLSVWNIGEGPIYGPTSLAYVVVAGLFARAIPLEAGLLLPTCSWSLGVLTLLVLFGIVRTLAGADNPVPVLAAILFLLWIILEPAYGYHSLSGMDTLLSVLAIAGLTWSCLSFRERNTTARLVLMTVCSTVCYLIRPDNLIYALLMPLLFLLLVGRAAPGRFMLIFVLLFGAVASLDALIKLRWFGELLPLSYYVKQSGFAQGYAGGWKWNPAIYLTEFIFIMLPALLIVSIYARPRHLRVLAALLLPMCLTFIYYTQVLQVMGGYARYYYPSLAPGFAAGIFVLSDTYTLDHAAINPDRTGLRRGIAALLLLIGMGTWGYVSFSASLKSQASAGFDTRALSSQPIPPLGWEAAIHQVGAIAGKLPPGTVLAATEVGFVGASAPQLSLIDMVGLNDPGIAHHGFSAAALLERRPDLIWLPFPDYVQMRRDLVCDPGFQQDYLYYPNAYDYGIAIRADSSLREGIISIVEQNWQQVYQTASLPKDLASIGSLNLLCK